jgi:tetratricopeptide (TPR) repeat protein
LKKFKESNEFFIKFIAAPGAESDYRDSFITANYIVGVNSYQLKLPGQSNEYLLRFLEIDKDKQSHLQWLPLAHFLVGSNGFDLLRKAVEQKEKTDIEGVAKLAKEDKLIVTHFTKALELGLDLEHIYLTLGNYYYYCRDLENAISNYKMLIEKFPDSPDISSYKDFLQQLEKDKEKK